MAEKYTRHKYALKIFYANLDKLIAEFPDKNYQIIIFGSGTPANMAIHYLKIHGMMVKAIIDNASSKQGNIIYGLPVYKPEDYLSEYKDDILVLISSSYEDSMIAQIKGLGYEDRHIFKLIEFKKAVSDYSFADRTGYRELNRFEIRQHQLNVLKHLKAVCDKYGLRYWLCGGTLLGAVRHKGYIPWDDDIDVYVEMNDLKKLAKLLHNDPDFGIATFVDESADICVPCAYMYETASDMDINYFPTQISCGISIDIFPLTGIPDEKKELENYLTNTRQLMENIWKEVYSEQKLRIATTELMNYMSRFDFEAYSDCGYTFSLYGTKAIAPAEGWKNTVEVEFEGETYKAPADWNYYLTSLYGESYMKLPPESERIPVHNFKAYVKK